MLIVMTDDQRADQMSAMPKTRRWLGAGGTRFTNAYATTPLCCPARASLFTGQYVHNHNVDRNIKGEPRVYSASSRFQQATVQRYLQEAGYRTGIVGKYMNGWNLDRDPHFFDRWNVMSGGYRRHGENDNGTRKAVDAYTTTDIRRKAVGFIQGSEEDDARPWFLHIALRAPHAPFDPAAKYRSAPVRKFRVTPAVTEGDRSDKPSWVRERSVARREVRRVWRKQLRTLRSVDDMVGRLFELMGELDERKDTIVFFLSDHGFLLGEHGVGPGKLHPYTKSVRIPLYMRWPGVVPAGERDGRFAANIDIAPTILEAAGITAEHEVDGRSLLGDHRRNRILLEWTHGPSYLPRWASIRTRRYQYIEWYRDEGGILFREYYDLRHDPWQVRNRLRDGNPSNDPDVGRLHTRLARARRCAGANCP